VNDRLYRSRSDRMLAGVAGGVAERFELDPSLVRVGWAILVILSGGIFLLIYIVMAIVVPEEPRGVGGAGWSSAGSAGWSTNWPAAGSPVPDPAPSAAGGATPPGSAPVVDPSAPADPGAGTTTVAGPDAPGFAAPGFAAPGSGGRPPAATSWPGDSKAGRRAARDARRAARHAQWGSSADRPGSGGIVAGLILVALGLYFLARTFVPQLDVDRFWPVGLVALGATLVILSIRRTPGSTAP
jgi:phage shock protein C